MGKILSLTERDEQTINRLLALWESSVRATHTFLSEDDIAEIKPMVKPALQGIEHLFCCFDDHNVAQGFIGVDGDKIEMLFVDAEARNQGIGKQLLRYAFAKLDIKYVDVNEQNEQGLGFYLYMGFHVIARSERDEQGKPFPILHLAIE